MQHAESRFGFVRAGGSCTSSNVPALSPASCFNNPQLPVGTQLTSPTPTSPLQSMSIHGFTGVGCPFENSLLLTTSISDDDHLYWSGSSSSSSPPSPSEFSLLYDESLSAITHANSATLTDYIPVVKDCSTILQMRVPKGHQFTITSIVYRGNMFMSPAVKGTISTQLKFDTGMNLFGGRMRKFTSSSPMVSTVMGPQEMRYLIIAKPLKKEILWSPCNKKSESIVRLVIESEVAISIVKEMLVGADGDLIRPATVSIHNGTDVDFPPLYGFLGTDPQNGKSSHSFQIKWKKC